MHLTLTKIVQKTYFNLSYKLGFAEWDTHSPQPDLVRIQENGYLHGNSVLDIGCGSGDNAIYLARKGFKVTGIDSSKNGIAAAKKRATSSQTEVVFLVADALALSTLDSTFDIAIDFGLYHNLRGKELAVYVDSIFHALKAGGQLILQCFSENAPRDKFGPRQVDRNEIENTFRGNWKVERIETAFYQTRRRSVPAWLSIIKREG